MGKINLQKADIEFKSMGLTMYAILEKRKTLKDNFHPIKIRITHKRKYRDYGTKQKATSTEWDLITAAKPKGDSANKKIQILGMLERAYNIITNMETFGFTEFNESYLDHRNNDKYNIFNWYKDKIKELEENGQLGTAQTYTYSMKALKDVSGKEVLKFDDITIKFLKKFEKEIDSPTSTGIYLRPLRHIFNRASQIVSNYPFNKGQYKIPNPRNIKKALTLEEVKRIYLHESPQGSPEQFYKDIWLFSYFANGMNIKDICQLTYSCINNDTIEFRRAKTINSNKDAKPISVILTDDLMRIIEDYGTEPKNKNSYIFPFLKKGTTAQQELLQVRQATKQTNKYIKRIAEHLKIEKNISTYSARHSFATILKNAGAAPSFIGESLGHSSLKTTESYLGSFETSQRKENINKLKDW